MERRMTSARKRYANAQNARRCTGPKSAAGKARSARNGFSHGLNLPVLADPALAGEAAALARRIVISIDGNDRDPRRLELASRIADAQVDLLRARRVRLALFERAFSDPKALATLLRMDRYERRIWSRRQRAIAAFDTVFLAERNQPRKTQRFQRMSLGGGLSLRWPAAVARIERKRNAGAVPRRSLRSSRATPTGCDVGLGRT
jgi:hypothetical protein